MKNTSFFTTAIAILGFVSASVAQTADEVVAKHLAAMGGIDKIKAVSSIKMEAKIQSPQAPGMDILMTMSAVHGKGFRQDITVMGMSMQGGYDGTTAWNNAPTMMGGSGNPEPLPAEQAERAKEQIDLAGALVDYASKGNSIELLGKEDLEGSEVFKLKVNKKNGDTEYHYIDSGSFLILKTETITKLKGQETKSSQLLSNYKEVNGMKFPFTIEQDNPLMGGTSSVNFTSILVNVPVDESAFKMPAKK